MIVFNKQAVFPFAEFKFKDDIVDDEEEDEGDGDSETDFFCWRLLNPMFGDSFSSLITLFWR